MRVGKAPANASNSGVANAPAPEPEPINQVGINDVHPSVHPDERMNVLEMRRMRAAVTQSAVSAVDAISSPTVNLQRLSVRRPLFIYSQRP